MSEFIQSRNLKIKFRFSLFLIFSSVEDSGTVLSNTFVQSERWLRHEEPRERERERERCIIIITFHQSTICTPYCYTQSINTISNE